MSTLDHSAIIFPRRVVDAIHHDIAQAHCTLTALIQMLRGHSDPDPQCLAHLLVYMEMSLQKTDQVISDFIAGGG